MGVIDAVDDWGSFRLVIIATMAFEQLDPLDATRANSIGRSHSHESLTASITLMASFRFTSAATITAVDHVHDHGIEHVREHGPWLVVALDG